MANSYEHSLWLRNMKGDFVLNSAPSREKVETCNVQKKRYIYFLIHPLWVLFFKWSWFHVGLSLILPSIMLWPLIWLLFPKYMAN